MMSCFLTDRRTGRQSDRQVSIIIVSILHLSWILFRLLKTCQSLTNRAVNTVCVCVCVCGCVCVPLVSSSSIVVFVLSDDSYNNNMSHSDDVSHRFDFRLLWCWYHPHKQQEGCCSFSAVTITLWLAAKSQEGRPVSSNIRGKIPTHVMTTLDLQVF